MSQQSPYIPPFANVRLIECRDYMELAPVPAFREFFAYGKKKAREVTVEREDSSEELVWPESAEDEEVWAVMQWIRYEDGHEEPGSIDYLRAPATEEDARNAMEKMAGFYSLGKEDLQALARCLKNTEDADAYIESRYPNYQSDNPHDIDAHDLYQARLKVLAGLLPETVRLIKQADATSDQGERKILEREAVQAYFADLAHYWAEDEILAWQRSNPIGTGWMREFVRVLKKGIREIDRVDYELAFNWLRRKYNLLTAKELSGEILKATLKRLNPGALKKRRERLGLTTKRPPGPAPREG